MDGIASSVLDLVGRTPLVRLNRIPTRKGVEVLAKLEGWNPMGSVKERIALSMVEEAEQGGRLGKGQILVESSSGNTGIGLAMVAAVKGYRVLVTMSEGASVERRQILKALGAEVVLTSAKGGSDEAWDRADEIARSDPKKYVRIHQYTSAANVEAHYRGTAEEIWAQTGGRLDALVVGLGTCGTIVGAGRRLKELHPDLKVIAVEPQPGHKQQGLRNLDVQRVPPIMDWSVVDEKFVVNDPEAFEMARRITREEGIFAGISCGSNLAGALRYAERLAKGRLVVTFPDRGEKYLSTALYPA